MGCLGISQYVLDGHLIACSPQRPLAPEARPKTVGTGPPAKPVLVRPTPQSLAPVSVSKAPKIPSKPVAAPILAQDWTAPESSRCLYKFRDFPDPPGRLGLMTSSGHLSSQFRPPLSWFGIPHSTQSTSHSPHSRSEASSSSTNSHPGQDTLRPAGGSPSALSFHSEALYWAHHHANGPLGNQRLRLTWSLLCWTGSAPLCLFVLVSREGVPIMGIVYKGYTSCLTCCGSPARTDGGKVFRRPPDPHEEALMILKGQKTQLAVVPGTQVEWVGYPVGIEASEASPLSMALCLSSTACFLPAECSVYGGTGVQRGCGHGEAGDQCPKAMHGAHSR